MNTRRNVAQPSRLRVFAASRGQDRTVYQGGHVERRGAARTRRRGRQRYIQRRIVAELDALLFAILDRTFNGEI